MHPQPGSPPATALTDYATEVLAEQRRALSVAFGVGSPLLLSFSLLDALVAPKIWWTLLALRLFGSAVLAVLSYALRTERIPVTVGAVAGLALVAIPISLGGLASGGPASPYLYALMLPSAGAPVIVPFRPTQVALITAEIAWIGFFPAVWLGGPEWTVAIPAASFYACMSVLTIVGAVVHDRLRRREHATRVEAVRQARLATLGQMSGSLAHELSNPLTVLLYHLEEAKNVASPQQSEGLETAWSAASRMSKVLDAMRRGARFSDGERQPVDLNHEIELSLSLVSNRLGKEVQITRELSPLPMVQGNPTLLGQLIVNLLVNAGDALRPVERPQLIVRSRSTPDSIVVELEDNGPGVPASLRDQLFEPFTSTKGSEGNGLGLWICSEIAEAHGGTLTLHDGGQGGALFRLALTRKAA